MMIVFSITRRNTLGALRMTHLVTHLWVLLVRVSSDCRPLGEILAVLQYAERG